MDDLPLEPLGPLGPVARAQGGTSGQGPGPGPGTRAQGPGPWRLPAGSLGPDETSGQAGRLKRMAYGSSSYELLGENMDLTCILQSTFRILRKTMFFI